MGRFPWSQGHSRQGSDKSIGKPQDWFSKNTNEPSRQALNDLMKEHNGAEGSESSKMRSRSGTVSSKMSKDSKSPKSDRVEQVIPRPDSRQSTFFEHLSFGTAGPEKQSRGLFNKGSRMMRRKTSKLSLQPSAFDDAVTFLSGQVAAGGARSPPAKTGYRGSLSPRGNDVRPFISQPFDFQHVAHTDQAQYQSLNRAFMMDVVAEGQKPAPQMQLTPTDSVVEPPLPSTLNKQQLTSPPLSPTTPLQAELPMTPPKPQPPPKDDLPLPVTPEVRLSKSTENFSRPTRSPVVSVDITPAERETFRTSLSVPPSPLPDLNVIPALKASPVSPEWADIVNESLSNLSSRRESSNVDTSLNKPLPQPPTVVHAVSTVDDSALMMRTAPLPDIPQDSTHVAPRPGSDVPQDKLGLSPSAAHRQSLRHMQTFPSGKSAKHRGQSSSDIPLAEIFTSIATSIPSHPASPKKRVSIGIKKIDIEDWEDAIDYSWDHPPDGDEESDSEVSSPVISHRSTPLPEQVFVAQQPPRNGRSLPASLKPLVFKPNQGPRVEDIQSPTIGHSLQKLHKSETCLQGLGIGGTQQAPDLRRQSNEALRRNVGHEGGLSPAMRRQPGSSISKSSSQESIILSIASSIMGTHRSSNSSTSLGDLSHLERIEDESTLPMENESSSNSSTENVSNTSQETVTTEPRTASTPATEAPSPSSKRGSFSSKKHARATSISRANLPTRISSIPVLSNPPASRSRSNTLNSRPRQNSRVSYSLFPTPKSPSLPPPPALPPPPTPSQTRT